MSVKLQVWWLLERSGSWYLKQPTAWRSEEIREIRGILEEVKLCQSLKGGVEVKAMVPHSSTLAWKIPWAEEPGGLESMGSPRVGHDWATSLSCTGEGSGNPLQCSCLENPRDRGAWWAAVYGVAQSRTRLKWLSSSSRNRNIYTYI